jgi:hypothetical protein
MRQQDGQAAMAAVEMAVQQALIQDWLERQTQVVEVEVVEMQEQGATAAQA